MSVPSDTMGPSGIVLSRCDGDLTIDSVGLRTAAWWIVDLSPAWRYGDKRGSNVVMPRASGERPYLRRRTGTTFTFQMAFGGLYTSSGDVATTPGAFQMYENFDELRAAIVDDDGDVTKPSTLITPDGASHNENVQVLDLSPGTLGVKAGSLMASLQIRVPAGGWV